MSRSSILLSAALVLGIAAPFAVSGCAAPTDDVEQNVEPAQDEADLTAAAKSFAGSYASKKERLHRLELKSNGKYTGMVNTGFVCVTAPCVAPESGTWTVTKKSGKFQLKLDPTGGPARTYDAVKAANKLTLTRLGQIDILVRLESNECLDNSDCASTKECAPLMCFMACLDDDPTCCGPSTCAPKAPDAGACSGAWLDNHGVCRTPADGAYPDECCAGQSNKCGTKSCGPGTECCNPLSGACVKNDGSQMCAF